MPPGQTKEHFIAERVARHKRADGMVTERRLLDGRVLHISDHRSQSAGIVVIGRDVTERLKIEEQLRQAQKMDAVGKLTGGVAHDFNNILMVILANVDAVLESNEGTADTRKYLENIASAGQRAAQLTQQLLAFSRKQTLQPQRTNLNDLVVTTGALLRRTLGEHFELDSLLAEALWPTDVDRAQVEAAVVNLCINARDAMPGGGRIVIETRNAALDADYVTNNPDATAGDHVMLSVTDSGSGISPEILTKVFEPFFTTKEVGKGTGLGLSMVYGFVRQSKGHVTIHSEVGRGTTVALYLPRSQQNAAAPTEKPKTGDPRGTERILIVEDEQAVREILMQQLSGLGYAVTEAGNGADGLALLRSGQAFDLLLTDIIMPGPINGKALADEAVKLSAGLPVLFMSGYSEDAISTLGPRLGRDAPQQAIPKTRSRVGRSAPAGPCKGEITNKRTSVGEVYPSPLWVSCVGFPSCPSRPVYLSLLKNPSGQGIGLSMKTATDEVRLSNRAPLSCDAVSLEGF